MTILGRTLSGPASPQDWLFLIALLLTVLVTMTIAAGTPTAGLAVVATAGAYVVDHRFFVPLAIALVGVLGAARGLRRQPRVRDGRQTVREGTLLGVGFLLYEFGRAAVVGEAETARLNAERVLSLERRLGMAFEPSVQRAILDRELTLRVINGVYSWGFLSFVLSALFWLFVADDAAYRLGRTALGISAALALVTIALFPTAPPRLLPASGLIDSHGFLGHGHGFVNQFAAVPSLHVGWTALLGLLLGRSLCGPLGWFFAIVPVAIMTFTVIATGNHFWFDAIVGSVFALAPALMLIRRESPGGFPIQGWWRSAVRRALAMWKAAQLLRTSPWAMLSAAGLGSLLLYLLGRQAVDPGFTHYWGYQVVQIAVTLVVLLAVHAMFAPEGGLSWYTHVVVTADTWADTLGTAGHFYDRYSVYDKITHFGGGVALTAVAANVLAALAKRGVVSWSLRVRLAAAVAIMLVLNIGWETYEWLGDAVFSTGRHQGNLDTIYDFVSDITGALVSAVLLWRLEPRSELATRPAAAGANRAVRG
jgi:uncharacterized membrane protein YjdF